MQRYKQASHSTVHYRKATEKKKNAQFFVPVVTSMTRRDTHTQLLTSRHAYILFFTDVEKKKLHTMREPVQFETLGAFRL